MSRIGKNPIPVPNGVTVNVSGQELSAKGKLGELKIVLVDEVLAEMNGDEIKVQPRDDSTRARTMWGMSRTLVSNVVLGVSEGFSKNLEIEGVGYRAQVQGKKLILQLGYSHDVEYPIPEGIQIKCERPTAITISGADRQKVGQIAAEIRGFRPPEPYKGKGVRYEGEYIFRKEGKKK
ncbi:MAG: 50S ribosomal protein L6 [Rhodospirillales bacterium]|jgi:large subunit ribosomal protein L6|nr:50S ribosomal protein L6 [Rhodospirillales bacterium]MBT5114321.1 50S ribosomal protein L6 [Rhodospirillales bacterium]MBT5672713.1 50S ribosomal protein L6 [Rhodospirillales bacterium]MBT6186938.1 50S ribosomal protein L6 [Rhodospirillales bacterium]MBT6743255.1 50S ribosomal protein L6 [Rhodospirillales bacterium]